MNLTSVARTASAATVAGVAAIASYRHMRQLAAGFDCRCLRMMTSARVCDGLVSSRDAPAHRSGAPGSVGGRTPDTVSDQDPKPR